MKVEIRTIEQKVYVADDGKQYLNKVKCQEHEAKGKSIDDKYIRLIEENGEVVAIVAYLESYTETLMLKNYIYEKYNGLTNNGVHYAMNGLSSYFTPDESTTEDDFHYAVCMPSLSSGYWNMYSFTDKESAKSFIIERFHCDIDKAVNFIDKH